MTVAWRLVKERHASEAFTGEGARVYGGRWNKSGTPMVYVSGSLSLAALELFVHLGTGDSRIRFVYFKVETPEKAKIDDLSNLPRDWRKEPPPVSTQLMGTEWAEKRTSAILRIPSVVIPIENNFALNPLHPDFQTLKITGPWPFDFDPRMWEKT